MDLTTHRFEKHMSPPSNSQVTVIALFNRCCRPVQMPKMDFSGIILPKPYILAYKRHRMSTTPGNGFCHPKLCHLSCTLLQAGTLHPKQPHILVFWGPEHLAQKCGIFSQLYTLVQQFICIIVKIKIHAG